MLYPLSYERKYQQYTAFWWSLCGVVSGRPGLADALSQAFGLRQLAETVR
jgi:hypothetical protein